MPSSRSTFSSTWSRTICRRCWRRSPAALRPGGRFLVSIPLGEGAGWEVGESGSPYYRALRSEAEFIAALAQAGLQPEWTERSVDDEESGWLCVLAQLT